MFRQTEQASFKITLYNPDGSVKEVLQPFNSIVEAKIKLRELGEPFGAKIGLLDS
jgi:hypothetical protein